MSVLSLFEARIRRLHLPWSGKWSGGRRLMTLAVASVGATAVLLAWSWVADGRLFVALMIASVCLAACAFWFLISEPGGRRGPAVLEKKSEWEARTRAHIPREEELLGPQRYGREDDA